MSQLNNSNHNWYVLYTKPKAEKSAETSLQKKGFETYLPCISTIRQWSDRKKKVIEPMFKSYLFVRTSAQLLYQTLQDDFIVYAIKFNNTPAIVREEEIDVIKKIEIGCSNIEVVDHIYQKGEYVKIIDGPFKGTSGILCKNKDKNKVAIKINSLAHFIIIEIPKNQISKIQDIPE